MKRWLFRCVTVMALVVIVSIQPAMAKQFLVGGEPLNLFAYASQSVQFSTVGDHYDTEQSLQQALFNFLVEGDYRPREDLTLYVSSLLTADLAYWFKDHDTSWEEKLFTESKDKLFVDDEYWQLLKEAHITWTPGPFLFRLGKQIVSWGEMDFFRIMDQINPLDSRRGFSDVEFETTVIPVWLMRAEWWPTLQVGWLEELGFQFVFNPNADFIPDQNPTTGNDAGGIWSAAYAYDNPLYPPFPTGLGLGTPKMYVGALEEYLEEPEAWKEGQEYGGRISLKIKGSILSVNGFYGRDNSTLELMTGQKEDPVLSPLLAPLLGQAVPYLGTASDGTSVIYPIYKGDYPRQKYVGVTWTGDLPIRSSTLGGVNPLLRMEVRYQIGKAFKNYEETELYKSDFLDTGVGIDWKVKIPVLNPRAYFTISPQFFYNRILDYPSSSEFPNGLWDLPDNDYYTVTLLLNTSYINGKLIPQLAWAHDINRQAHIILPSLAYSYSREWNFKLEGGFMMGAEENTGFWLFRNKDYIAVKIKYSWG